MRAVFQFPASMTSVVDAPRAVSSDASPTRPLCAVTRASMPAARANHDAKPTPQRAAVSLAAFEAEGLIVFEAHPDGRRWRVLPPDTDPE